MSDINIEFEWWELVLISPMIGWPGIIIGVIVGPIAWRKRPIVGGALGAIIGNFVFAFARVYFT